MQRLRSVLTPWRALLLAALLLAAQAAGLAHRVAHGPAAAGGATSQAFWGHAAPAAPAALAASGASAEDLAHAHAHPASEAEAECRLYDQLLGHADALIDTGPPAAAPAPVHLAPLPDRACRSRSHVAAYQARAPPLA